MNILEWNKIMVTNKEIRDEYLRYMESHNGTYDYMFKRSHGLHLDEEKELQKFYNEVII